MTPLFHRVQRWSFRSRPLSSVSFFLSVSQAFSRGGLSTRWNLPASNTWKSPFRERDDSLLCVSNGRFRRASVTPSWSQSRLDCEDYLLRLFRGFGEKIVPPSFCFSFSFSLLSARFLFRLTFGGKVWNGSFSFWYILFFFFFFILYGGISLQLIIEQMSNIERNISSNETMRR